MSEREVRPPESEPRKFAGRSTQVYMENVMQRVFRRNMKEHLDKLLKGDRATLELCAQHLAKNLDFFELVHTLCLVTGQRFDLEHKEGAKAADSWLCWYEERKEALTWDPEHEVWAAPK